MKKILFLVLVICLSFAFCACGEKAEPEVTATPDEDLVVVPLDETSGDDEFINMVDVYLPMTFDGIELKIDGKKVDLDYAKSYYRVLQPLESNYDNTCATVQVADQEFPALVIKSGDEIFAYQYEGGEAKAIDPSNLKLDGATFAGMYECINTFENAVIEQGSLCELLNHYREENTTFEDLMNKYLTDEDGIFYGSYYYGEVYEDGTELEQSTFITNEDGKLYFNLYDSGLHFEKKIPITGIDKQVVLGVVHERAVANGLEQDIYQLTEDGNVYLLDNKNIRIIEPDTIPEEMKANKIVSTGNIISLEPIQTYPAVINENGEMIVSYYGFTLDGNLVPLR